MMEGSKGKRKQEARHESGESASEASEARQDAKKAPKESGSRRGKTLGPSKTRVMRQSKLAVWLWAFIVAAVLLFVVMIWIAELLLSCC